LCSGPFPVTTLFNDHLNTNGNSDGSILFSCDQNWQGLDAFYYISYRSTNPADLQVDLASVALNGSDVPLVSKYLKNNTEIKSLV
jgi:hypothetical protein